MLEEQLRKFWFFNYTGGFSVNKKSRTLVESLRYTSELLQNSKNMVVVFPQGEIQSQYTEKAEFEKGVEKILQYTKNEIQILFVANFTEYFSEPKASVFIHFEEYPGSNFSTKVLQKAYNNFFTEKKKELDNFR